MEWGKLLSEERERRSVSGSKEFRNAFDMDYERVISSSSIRRLQDKTQLYPLQENDFTRTRLTHSLEVSSIARSLGRRVGHELLKKNEMKPDEPSKLASLLGVAGLVHDLGNPPFGHYGEDIIRNWFDKNWSKNTDKTWAVDFKYFDGNAMTIRILSRLQCLKDRYGMNFSYGTLGTLVKYPWGSSCDKAKAKKKIGYFESDKELIQKVFIATGMTNGSGSTNRHPATFLLEAADDIAYLFADLEDTAKKGYLPWDEKVKDEILNVASKFDKFKNLKDELTKVYETAEANNLSSTERVINEVMVLRVFCQGVCIESVAEEFIEHYLNIMAGSYDGELLNGYRTKELVGVIKRLCTKYAYQSNEVLSLELIGNSVLTTLLDEFVTAMLDENNKNSEYKKPKCKTGKLFSIISPNFKKAYYWENGKININKDLNEEERIRLVVDYIACMTDSYALNLHKTLTGVRVP